jgi:hypothetical protein
MISRRGTAYARPRVTHHFSRCADGLNPNEPSHKGVPEMRIELVDLLWWLRKR